MLTPVGVNMKDKSDIETRKRVLLTGVFGPFGVDDEYGRKENIMELFHNQVTKGQGIASFRFHHRSFGLYFIASNIDADVTVLDFPSKKRFEKELQKGYGVILLLHLHRYTSYVTRTRERCGRKQCNLLVLFFAIGHGRCTQQ